MQAAVRFVNQRSGRCLDAAYGKEMTALCSCPASSFCVDGKAFICQDRLRLNTSEKLEKTADVSLLDYVMLLFDSFL